MRRGKEKKKKVNERIFVLSELESEVFWTIEFELYENSVSFSKCCCKEVRIANCGRVLTYENHSGLINLREWVWR